MTRFIACLATALLMTTANAAELLWPLPEHTVLTGGFADSRPDHFHGGIDVRTGPTPIPVVAPSDGWIERVAVTPNGYGRTLYYRLADGRTAVFGHLSRFIAPLEKMLRDSQLVRETYRIDMVFHQSEPHRCFNRGDTIAFSGKSGAGPAHFHFEIREGEIQTDPLASYPRPDNQPPVITGLRWTTLSGFTPWNSGNKAEIVRQRAGQYTSKMIRASEPVALLIGCYDPASWGRHAVPSVVRVKVDGKTIREDRLTRIGLLGPRDIYAKIVWAEREKTKRDIRRLFAIPPKSLARDSIFTGEGWIANVTDADVVVEVEDRAGNITQVSIKISAGDWPAVKPELSCDWMAGDFRFDAGNDPCATWMDMKLVAPDELRISPQNLAFGERHRLERSGIKDLRGRYWYQRSATGYKRPLWNLNGDYGGMACHILRAGSYGIAEDHEIPSLTLSVKNGVLHFRLTDLHSAIDDATVRCKIDGSVAIAEFEYEERGGAVWTPQILTRGIHDIEFSAADRAGNVGHWRRTVNIP